MPVAASPDLADGGDRLQNHIGDHLGPGERHVGPFGLSDHGSGPLSHPAYAVATAACRPWLPRPTTAASSTPAPRSAR